MISYLEGAATLLTDRSILVLIGGIGYKVSVTPEDVAFVSSHQGEQIKLFTHLAVREDALDLYGFSNQEELGMFELLIGVSGIGPKSALGILSVADSTTLRSAISSSDISYLTKVSGIGRKTSEKIILELRDKFGVLELASKVNLREESDAVEALKSLGYSPVEAREALKNVSDEITGTSERVKRALKFLSN